MVLLYKKKKKVFGGFIVRDHEGANVLASAGRIKCGA